MRVAFVCEATVSRVLFTRLGTALGHEVSAVVPPREPDVSADSADRALIAAIAATRPDIVIVDGHLGDPRGTRVAGSSPAIVLVAGVRSALPAALVGVVAALGETALVRAAADAGAQVVVPRPLLRSGIRAALAPGASGDSATTP